MATDLRQNDGPLRRRRKKTLLGVISMLEGPSPNPTDVDAKFDSPDSSSQPWKGFGAALEAFPAQGTGKCSDYPEKAYSTT